MRKEGSSVSNIASVLGISTVKVRRLLDTYLRDYRQDATCSPEEQRLLDAARLDDLLKALWRETPTPKVADTILAVLARKAKLLGLDAKNETEETGMSKLSDKELRDKLRKLQADLEREIPGEVITVKKLPAKLEDEDDDGGE